MTRNHLKVRRLVARLSEVNWRLLQLPPHRRANGPCPLAPAGAGFCLPVSARLPVPGGLSTQWVWQCYQQTGSLECDYESQLEQLTRELDEANQRLRQQEQEERAAQGRTAGAHRRQFQGRRGPPARPRRA